jgi:hypothetical protein
VYAGKRALDDGAGAQIQRRQPRQISGVEQPGPRWLS